MHSIEISTKSKVLVLGLIMVVLFIPTQEYSYTNGQSIDNQTGNQTGNQTDSSSSEQEFEEGEEIGEEETL
jgi:hypothetical protein